MRKSIILSAALCGFMICSSQALANSSHFHHISSDNILPSLVDDDTDMNDSDVTDNDAIEGSNGFNALFENESPNQNSHHDDGDEIVAQNVEYKSSNPI